MCRKLTCPCFLSVSSFAMHVNDNNIVILCNDVFLFYYFRITSTGFDFDGCVFYSVFSWSSNNLLFHIHQFLLVTGKILRLHSRVSFKQGMHCKLARAKSFNLQKVCIFQPGASIKQTSIVIFKIGDRSQPGNCIPARLNIHSRNVF